MADDVRLLFLLAVLGCIAFIGIGALVISLITP